MPVTHNDLLKFSQHASEQRAQQAEIRKAAAAEVGRRAQMAMDSPGWGLFEARMNELIQRADTQLFVDTQLALNSVGAEAEKAKLDVHRVKGLLEGLHAALSMLPDLVKAGQG